MTLTDFEARLPGGSVVPLSRYAGQLVLIVNVASQCGFTPQYLGLEQLYRKRKAEGFVILGFPCNQFLFQEPGDADSIRQCGLKYNVTFPIFEKIEVNGGKTHPLFAWLKSECPGTLGTSWIKWNFTKFLVNREGHAIRRWGSGTTPANIDRDLAKTST